MPFTTMAWKPLLVVSLVITVIPYGNGEHSASFVVKETMYGQIRGYTQEVFPRRPVDIFLGVPYASPPVGKLRFEPPQALPHWDGILNTTELSAACAQSDGGLGYVQAHYPGFDYQSEDCLYLNIFAPQLRKGFASLPVLVFVHGGSNDAGMGGMFDGSIIASFTDIILVTFNYRLGPIGFLSTHSEAIPGNYGLLDQLAALRWVRDNIHFFGGDPERVTLWGHSSGSCDVGLLMLSPLSKGLFQSAITQSGAPTSSLAMKKPMDNDYAKEFGAHFGCDLDDSRSLKACLQEIPVQELVNFKQKGPYSSPIFLPVVDGHVLTDHPDKLLQKASVHIEQMFTGFTKNEGSLPAAGVIKTLQPSTISTEFFKTVLQGDHAIFPTIEGNVDLLMYEYSDWGRTNNSMATLQQFAELLGDAIMVAPTAHMADMLAAKNVSVYMYSFEHRSRLSSIPRWAGVFHGQDMFYIFGAPLSGHPLHNYTDGDKRMSEMMMTVWGNYVKYGVPGTYKTPDEGRRMFDTYSPPKTSYTRLMSERGAPKTRTEKHLRPRKMAFWNDLLPKLRSASKEELKKLTTVTQEGIDFEMMTWIFVAVSSALFLALFILAIYVVRVKSKMH